MSQNRDNGAANHSLRRNSLRYHGYDYSQPGATFVTINTHDNQRLFGNIRDGQVHLSPAGAFVSDAWCGLPIRFPEIIVDDFVVMPDHIHGIIFTGTDQHLEGHRNTIGFIANSFKNTVNAAWRKGVAEAGWSRYQGKLWHRDYYDRIIRNAAELDAIREYIAANPSRWSERQAT